jgi:Fur family peroxide stress response transcriptional regulator
METLEPSAKAMLESALDRAGLRATRQRELIFRVLLEQRDHPTADEVLQRARGDNGTISLATVYNCLDTLVSCGLVKAVNFEREPTRYCPNLSHHAHFQDAASGRVYDVPLSGEFVEQLKAILPEGYEAEHVDLYFHGKTTGFNTKNN